MSNKLLDLNGLSYFKLQQDAYNATQYAAAGSIPTVNDATLTITQNGTTVATFTANSATNTSAAITVPTAVSDLTNDSGFITSSDIPTDVSDFTNDADYQTGSEVSAAIAAAIAGITGISFEIVQTLPATGDAGTIYLVPNSGSGSNIYDEYIWIEESGVGRFEKIGSTAADFTDVAYYDSVNNRLSANSAVFWTIATNSDIATLFA